MPQVFNLTLAKGPSWKHSTLKILFELFLSLEKYPDVLAEIMSLLHRPEKGRKEYAMNSLHKNKTRKETRINIHIEDYDVDSFILDLGSDVNILTKQTWEKMGKPQLVWSPMQL